MLDFQEKKDGIIIKIKVIPGSSQSMIAGVIDNTLKIKLHSPPIDGRANKECIAFLSKLLKTPKSSISIINGEKNKLKTLYIKGEKEVLKSFIKSIKN